MVSLMRLVESRGSVSGLMSPSEGGLDGDITAILLSSLGRIMWSFIHSVTARCVGQALSVQR